MNIWIFLGIAVGSVLIIDAIRFRIIYFKFKKLDIYDYREIVAYIDDIKKSVIPVDMEIKSVDDIKDLNNKMEDLVKVLSIANNFNSKKLELLIKDMDFLSFYYDENNEAVIDLLNESEILKNSYNTVGGKDGDKEEGN